MTPDSLLAAINSPEPEDRRQAVIAMASTDVPNLAEVYLVALGDADWRVREEAARVGGHLADRIDLFPLLIAATCQGENVGLRNSAIAVLGSLGIAAVAALEQALGEVAHEAKKFVIEAIAAAGGEAAAPALIHELNTSDPNIVAAVIEALAVAGGRYAEQALRDLLRRDGAFQRMAALDALNRLGARLSWQELAPMLEDRLVWRVALPALGRCRNLAAIPVLLQALEDNSDRVLSDAVAALDQLCGELPAALDDVALRVRDGSPRLHKRLLRLSQHSELFVRQGAVLLLMLAQDPDVIDAMLALMREEVLPAPQLAAAQRWGADLVALLLDRLARTGASERGLSLQLAGELTEELMEGLPEAARRKLLSRLRAEARRALSAGDSELRVAAASALVGFAEAEDAVPLVMAATGEDWDLCDAAGPALLTLARTEPDAVCEALEPVELSDCAQEYIAELVARLDKSRALSRLHGALLSDDPAARAAAVAGLGIIGGLEAARLIVRALGDHSPLVQLRAAAALGRMDSEEERNVAMEALVTAASEGDPTLQAAAARALGDTGLPGAVGPLVELTLADDSAVVVEALNALRALDAPQLEELLSNAVGKADALVVKQALELLHGVNAKRARLHIERALEHERWDVRQSAVRLLSSYRDRTARSTLHRALTGETDRMVRGEIEAALRRAGKVA